MTKPHQNDNALKIFLSKQPDRKILSQAFDISHCKLNDENNKKKTNLSRKKNIC